MNRNAHDLAMKYLAHRDRTAKEIQDHLTAKGVEEDGIAECLQYLFQAGLVDDEDYCGRYILYAMGKGRGPLRIRKDLTEKGIRDDLIDMGLEEHFAGEGECTAARSLVYKLLQKEEPGSPMSEKDIARIGRRLASRGFHSNVIYEIIDWLRSEQLQVDRD